MGIDCNPHRNDNHLSCLNSDRLMNVVNKYLARWPFLAPWAVAVLGGLLFAILIWYLLRNQSPSIISIKPSPDARFIEHEIYFQVEAKDPEGEVVQYHWEFGDGSFSTEQNPEHYYAKGGDYIVKLTVSDPNDAKQTVRFRIHINQPPRAVASASPLSGTPPLTVRFDASGSADPDTTSNQGLKYYWDFGDGKTSSDARTVHRYERVGEYTAILVVEDADGARDQVKIPITVSTYVNQAPIPQIQLSTNQGLIGDEIAFDGSRSRDHDGEIVSYEWDFDSDNRTDAQGPHATYRFSKSGQYHVKLTVIDNKQERRSAVSVIQIREPQPPVARFIFSPTEPHVGDDVYFDASNSMAPDSRIMQYMWDLNGDGKVDKRGARISEQFALPGKYLITLTVTDNRGQQNRFSQEIQVLRKSNQPPIARLRVNNVAPTVGQSVTLDASDSYDLDGKIIRYEWDLDSDGKSDRTTTVPRLAHTFNAAGQHEVRVTVFDNNGESSIFTLKVQVTTVGITPFLSGGIAMVGPFRLYRGAIGFPLSHETAGEVGYAYGEGYLQKGNYPLTFKMIVVDFNVFYKMTTMFFVGSGVGVLIVNGEYKIDWPVLGSQSFTQYVPVFNLKVGFKIGFLMLSMGVSYASRE